MERLVAADLLQQLQGHLQSGIVPLVDQACVVTVVALCCCGLMLANATW